MTNARSLRGFAFPVAAIGIAVIASLGFCEAALRVFAHRTNSPIAQQLRYDPFGVKIEAHGLYGYRQKPNLKFEFPNGAHGTSNALAFRGPIPVTRKSAGMVRVILVGGSTTHGWGVDDEFTIDRFLQKELVRRHPHLTFEVINLGADGYDSYQIYERLKYDGLRFDPDFVIIHTGVNDVRNAHFPNLRDADPRANLWLGETARSRAELQRGGPTAWTRVKHLSYLARLPGILNRVPPRIEKAAGPFPDALDYFQRNIQRSVDLLRHTPATLLLSTEPSALLSRYQPGDTSPISYWLKDAVTTQAYRDSLAGRLSHLASCARNDGVRVARVPYLELPPDVFIDDAHLTPEGNRRVALAFADALDPFVARLLPSGAPGGR